MTYSEFEGSRLARRIRAEQLLVVPRRVGALQLSPLSELVLTRPAIEIHEATGAPPPAAPAPAASPVSAPPFAGSGSPALLGLAAVRHLAFATLFDPTFTFVRDGVPVARLVARRATADAGSRDLLLRGVRLEHVPGGRTLTAERAVWLAREDALWIKGQYVLTDGGKTTRGRGLRVELAPRGERRP